VNSGDVPVMTRKVTARPELKIAEFASNSWHACTVELGLISRLMIAHTRHADTFFAFDGAGREMADSHLNNKALDGTRATSKQAQLAEGGEETPA
jgi:hypothetical protein